MSINPSYYIMSVISINLVDIRGSLEMIGGGEPPWLGDKERKEAPTIYGIFT